MPAGRGECIGCLIYIGMIAIGTGITYFIIWFSALPEMVKFQVTGASLTEFNYTNNTLHYNLALNLTIRNPNKRLGIYYDDIEAQTLFQDAKFDSQKLGAFYQGHKNTTVLSHVFVGQQALALGAEQASELEKEKGVYGIQVRLHVTAKFHLGTDKLEKQQETINCNLKVPLISSNNGTSSATALFQTTKCDGGIIFYFHG